MINVLNFNLEVVEWSFSEGRYWGCYCITSSSVTWMMVCSSAGFPSDPPSGILWVRLLMQLVWLFQVL